MNTYIMYKVYVDICVSSYVNIYVKKIYEANKFSHTLCSEKNTHSYFLLHLHGKCLDLHKIFQECLVGNKHSTAKKVRYSLLLVTSCL